MEAGPKGILVNFRENRFANPAGLVEFISAQGKNAKLRPDHTLVYLARGDNPAERIREAGRLARGLARVAGSQAE